MQRASGRRCALGRPLSVPLLYGRNSLSQPPTAPYRPWQPHNGTYSPLQPLTAPYSPLQLVQVRDFYANWEAFATARLFSSADKYDTRAAPNRQVRRAMETAATHVSRL